jgi:hypothetical protein
MFIQGVQLLWLNSPIGPKLQSTLNFQTILFVTNGNDGTLLRSEFSACFPGSGDGSRVAYR